MDVVYVVPPKGTSGLSRYAEELVRPLSAFLSLKKRVPGAPNVLKLFSKITKSSAATTWETIPLNLPLPKNKLIHLTNQKLAFPLFFKRKRKVIVTVHDIIPIVRKEHQSQKGALLERLPYRALKYATHLITDSAHTKEEITKTLHINPNKITVVPLAVNHNEFFDKKLKRDKATFLYVGAESPRKNFKTTVEALAIVRKSIPEVKLIKVGAPGWRGAREMHKKIIASLDLQGAVTFVDHADDLALYYNKATAFVFPSLYEGFGLPVLEAMACGCPVIAFPLTCVPEVGGNAIQYTKENTAESLAKAMVELFQDKKEQKRLSIAGKKRAKQFTWEKVAKETFAVYKKVLGKSEGSIQ